MRIYQISHLLRCIMATLKSFSLTRGLSSLRIRHYRISKLQTPVGVIIWLIYKDKCSNIKYPFFKSSFYLIFLYFILQLLDTKTMNRFIINIIIELLLWKTKSAAELFSYSFQYGFTSSPSNISHLWLDVYISIFNLKKLAIFYIFNLA